MSYAVHSSTPQILTDYQKSGNYECLQSFINKVDLEEVIRN